MIGESLPKTTIEHAQNTISSVHIGIMDLQGDVFQVEDGGWLDEEGRYWGWQDTERHLSIVPCPRCRKGELELAPQNDGNVAPYCRGQCSEKALHSHFKKHFVGLKRRVPPKGRKSPRVERPIDSKWGPNPFGNAWRLIVGYAPQLMAARIPHTPGGDNLAYSFTLHDGGAWDPSGDTFAEWHKATCEIWQIKAVEALSGGELSPRDANEIVAYLKKAQSRAQANEAGRLVQATSQDMEKQGFLPEGLTRTQIEDMDRNPRYLSAGNGVVDLATGKLLDAREARAHLVMHRNGIDFKPGAQHWAVDKLFAHLDAGRSDYLKACLGRAMWGQPEREFLAIVGPPASGKTTLFNAIRAALGKGGHGEDLSEDALRLGDTKHRVGPTEERRVLAEARMALAEETADWRISPEKLKSFSGGGFLSYQPKYGKESTRRVLATILLNANRMPRLGLADAALADRLRVVTYTPPEEPDPSVKDAFLNDPAAGEAMFALLVRLARENPTGRSVPVPAIVQADIDEAVMNDQTPFQRWLGQAVVDSAGWDAKIAMWVVWAAWAGHNGAEAEQDEIGGQKKARIAEVFRSMFHPGPSGQVFIDGRKSRGWTGFSLAAGADSPGFLLDGEAGAAHCIGCGEQRADVAPDSGLCASCDHQVSVAGETPATQGRF